MSKERMVTLSWSKLYEKAGGFDKKWMTRYFSEEGKDFIADSKKIGGGLHDRQR